MVTFYLLLLSGLMLLFISGKFLVESSVSISRLLGIPTMVIGLTVVAIGTSAPELLVSVQAALNGFPEIAMGNVVGSNMSNILLVLAITALIFPIPVPETSVKRDWPVMMSVTVLLYLFTLNGWLSQLEGIVFLGLLAVYIWFSVYHSKRESIKREKSLQSSMRWWVALIIFLVSCGGLAFGADLLVTNAAVIAEDLGLSKRVISITMVAVGTSIPELATSVIAALKKETDISVGNIIGSNIINIVSVLGFTSIIGPIRVEPEISRFDIPSLLVASLILLFLMLPAARSQITRWKGVIMILIYLLYIYLIF